MKGIILAGGTGSRLHPITKAISKQLMPVYDKPMIYYPLSTLMMAGIREILVVTTPDDVDQFRRLLGDGTQWGMHLDYAVQPEPKGLGTRLAALADVEGAHIFGCHVADPHAYGVVEFDRDGRVLSIEEKPERPRSSYAVPGLYFYDNQVVEIAASLQPSERGELEITDVHAAYLQRDRLHVTLLPRGTAWLDTGTFATLVQAAEFVRVVEERQAQKIGCPEEVAWRNGWIDDSRLLRHAEDLAKSGYGSYLRTLMEHGR
jgi:glucose-1-phosphate thymidylyltransferase